MFLYEGASGAKTTILLAHGAGAPMDSRAMAAASGALAAAGLRVARFEFDYMAGRRGGTRRPPPRAQALIPEFHAALDKLAPEGDLIIGGKSMGGRVASMIADDVFRAGRIRGLLCLGYPFHPPGKPDQLRTQHLVALETPALIVQGTRDPFGVPDEVASYGLSPHIALLWLEDGDHDLVPRKRLTGLSATDHLATMAKAVATWSANLRRPAGPGASG